MIYLRVLVALLKKVLFCFHKSTNILFNKTYVQLPWKPSATWQNKQVGFFKDKISPSLYIREFIMLKSKCYALKARGKKTVKLVFKKTCKGNGRECIKKRLKFHEYKKALFNMEDKVKRISRQPMFDSCHQQKQSAMWIFSLSIRW